MHTLDIVAIVVIALSVLWALHRGFSEELSALLAWGGAVILCYFSYHFVAEKLMPWVNDEKSSRTVAIIVSFIVLLVVLRMVSRSFTQFLKKNILGGLDRILGIVFGALRGYLVLVIAFIGMRYFFPDTAQELLDGDSHAAAPLRAGMDCFESIEEKVQQAPSLPDARDVDPGAVIDQP